MIMIEASPIAYLGGMLAVGKQGEQEGGDLKAIRHPPTPLFLWSCSARAEQGRLPRKRQWRHPTAPPHASHTGTLAPCHGPLARGPRRGRRVDVSLGLARGSGCPRKDGLWARPGPRQDGDAWWQGHTRHDRCAQDGGAPPGGPAPPGLWLSRAEAGAPCPLTPPPPLRRQRAARLAHVHTPQSPSTLPASGQTMASKAHRAGVADRLAAPAVPKSSARLGPAHL